eukprot:GDKI01047532.1.p1 GENE.GDKI01047532.1~~GDKI01047532.1.p1  ORF type:complete len:224 (-),score=28.76 GDKI01047532.1:68-739(-)
MEPTEKGVAPITQEEEQELVIQLFCEWYGVKMPTFRAFGCFNETHFADIWANKWFAKKEKQALMDTYLQKFTPLFAADPDTLRPAGLPAELSLIWDIAFFLLWDQVSRNIFRRTARAYGTDMRAKRWVEERIMPHWGRLPLAVKVSVILVYVHSEHTADLHTVEKLLQEIQQSMVAYGSVWGSLTGIANNHRTRMTLFGRIPERNVFLQRESNPDELAFMAAM